jgi:hypothetical protein
MRKLVFAGLVAASFLRPAVAAADTVTLVNTGPSSSYQYGWSVGEGGWVDITTASTGATIEGWAGQINWLVNGTQSVVTYCADLFDNALTTQTSMSVSSSTPLTSALASGQVAWLVDTFGATASADTSGVTAEALQIAIWDTMYAGIPGDGFTVTSSTGAPLSDGVSSLITSYVTQATQAGNTATAMFYNASASDNGQGQVTGTPEPSSIFLMMLGTCVAFGYQYRLKQRSAIVA